MEDRFDEGIGDRLRNEAEEGDDFQGKGKRQCYWNNDINRKAQECWTTRGGRGRRWRSRTILTLIMAAVIAA